jgi:hypothetical protein
MKDTPSSGNPGREPATEPDTGRGMVRNVIGWIVLAIVVVSVAVLALGARATARRLPALRQAQADLQVRVQEAEALQELLADVQKRQAAMQDKLALVQHRIGIIKGRLAKKGKKAG